MHSTAIIVAALIPLGLAAPLNSRQIPGEAVVAGLGNGILTATGLSTATDAVKGSLALVESEALNQLKARNGGHPKRDEEEMQKRQVDLFNGITEVLGDATGGFWPEFDQGWGENSPLQNTVDVVKRQEASTNAGTSAGAVLTGLLGGATENIWPKVDGGIPQNSPLATITSIVRSRQESSAGDALTGLLGGATENIWPKVDGGVPENSPLATIISIV